MVSFNLGLNQKRFGGNNQIANVSINLGSTKGIGSSTRMFNYCNQRSANPSDCINQFINVSSNVSPLNYFWSALGRGLTTTDVFVGAYSIAIDSLNNIYVGGQFTSAGDVSANYIAKWNSNTSIWSALDNGLTGGGTYNRVSSIVIDSTNNVYVAGQFTTAGTVSANNIAKWNSNTRTWSALGSGITGSIASIAIDSLNNVYTVGQFTSAGGVSAKNIAKWNPNTSTWSALGSGLNNDVESIAIDSLNNVYVAGYFTSAGGVPVNYIAKWNPNTSIWSALGSGLGPSGIDIYSIAIDSVDNVYVGGQFTSAGGISVNNIAKWNSNTNVWSALTSGINFYVISIAIDSVDNVYVGGQFTTAGGVSANNIAKWNPNTSTWSALGTGTNTGANINVKTVAIDSVNNVYIGGSFTSAGGVPANYIAKWGV